MFCVLGQQSFAGDDVDHFSNAINNWNCLSHERLCQHVQGIVSATSPREDCWMAESIRRVTFLDLIFNWVQAKRHSNSVMQCLSLKTCACVCASVRKISREVEATVHDQTHQDHNKPKTPSLLMCHDALKVPWPPIMASKFGLPMTPADCRRGVGSLGCARTALHRGLVHWGAFFFAPDTHGRRRTKKQS
jgi:hypothetical protein